MDWCRQWSRWRYQHQWWWWGCWCRHCEVDWSVSLPRPIASATMQKSCYTMIPHGGPMFAASDGKHFSTTILSSPVWSFFFWSITFPSCPTISATLLSSLPRLGCLVPFNESCNGPCCCWHEIRVEVGALRREEGQCGEELCLAYGCKHIFNLT